MTIPKFRAWDEDSQKMNGNVEIYINKDKTIEVRPKDDKTIIMQSTGLVDENGKEIFEGDIIRDSDKDIGVVVHDKDYGAYGLEYKSGIILTFEDLEELGSWQGSTVVGNIYENPELLEENNGSK